MGAGRYMVFKKRPLPLWKRVLCNSHKKWTFVCLLCLNCQWLSWGPTKDLQYPQERMQYCIYATNATYYTYYALPDLQHAFILILLKGTVDITWDLTQRNNGKEPQGERLLSMLRHHALKTPAHHMQRFGSALHQECQLPKNVICRGMTTAIGLSSSGSLVLYVVSLSYLYNRNELSAAFLQMLQMFSFVMAVNDLELRHGKRKESWGIG